jgi:hypothetical protein
MEWIVKQSCVRGGHNAQSSVEIVGSEEKQQIKSEDEDESDNNEKRCRIKNARARPDFQKAAYEEGSRPVGKRGRTFASSSDKTEYFNFI